jgi:IS5 family transposase
VPRLVAADAGFYSASNEAAAKAKGVKRVCIPNRPSKSAAPCASRRSDGSATASDGAPGAKAASASASAATVSAVAAIEVNDQMQRWVGLGVIADNLINLCLAIAKQLAK